MNYRIFQLILIDKKNRLSWYVTKNTLLYNYEKRFVATDLFIKKKKNVCEKDWITEAIWLFAEI